MGWCLVGELPINVSPRLANSWHLLSPSQAKRWLGVEGIGELFDLDETNSRTAHGHVCAYWGDARKACMGFLGDLDASLSASGLDPRSTRLPPQADELLERACQAARESSLRAYKRSDRYDLAWAQPLVLKFKGGALPDLGGYLSWIARQERSEMAEAIQKASKELMLASGLRPRAQKVADAIERSRSERREGIDMSQLAADIERDFASAALKAMKTHKRATPPGCGYTAAELAARLSRQEALFKLPTATAAAAHAGSLKHFCFDGAFGSELARVEPKDIPVDLFDSMPACGASLAFPPGCLEDFAPDGLRAHWAVSSLGWRRMATLALQWRFSAVSEKESADNIVGLTIDIENRDGPETLTLLEAEWNRQMSRLVSKTEFSLGFPNPGWTASKAKKLFDRIDQAGSFYEPEAFENFLKASPMPDGAKEFLERIWREGALCIESAYNGLSYVCCQNAELAREVVDRSDAQPRQPAAHPAVSALAATRAGLLSGKFEQDLIWCGTSIGQALRNLRVVDGAEAPASRGKKAKSSYHIRRGHPHSYWVGPRNGVQKLIVKYVRATAINAPKQMAANAPGDSAEQLLFPKPSGYRMGPK